MKRFPLRLLLVASTWIITSSAVNPQDARPAKVHQVEYYWYDEPQDNFDNFDTTDDMINTWQNLLGVPINTIPGGGTLILKGYTNDAYPHNLPCSVYLYAHE